VRTIKSPRSLSSQFCSLSSKVVCNFPSPLLTSCVSALCFGQIHFHILLWFSLLLGPWIYASYGTKTWQQVVKNTVCSFKDKIMNRCAAKHNTWTSYWLQELQSMLVIVQRWWFAIQSSSTCCKHRWQAYKSPMILMSTDNFTRCNKLHPCVITKYSRNQKNRAKCKSCHLPLQ
jgi:hypothetical protein